MRMYKCTEEKLRQGVENGPGRDIQRFLITERLKRSWTQYQMAKALGVSQSSISRLESGVYKDFSLGFLLDIADKLGCEPRITFSRKKEVDEDGKDSGTD